MLGGMATTTIASLGTILSIWAHPDDETYLAGGLMAAATHVGQRVVCVTATAGERGTEDPQQWPPGRLGAVRRLEAAAAMAVLGVSEHHVLGQPDGGLASCDTRGVHLVGELLDAVRPDTIVTFAPDGMTFHPDHIAIHRWVTTAWQQRNQPARLLYARWSAPQLAQTRRIHEEHGVYMTDLRPVGVAPEQLAVHVQLKGEDLDRKIVALRAMATQTGPLVDALGPDRYAAHVADECFVDAT
jgi:LmbE family N-acetylglucosaminyl deacetylase